jgi:hypothetical protein
MTCCFMFPNKWCDDGRSCINLFTLKWKNTTHSIGKSIQSNDICICFAIFSMSIISSHQKEFVSLTMCVKKTCGIPKCLTMQTKSCSCVLCHGGVLIMCGKIVFNNLFENIFFTHFGILCFTFFYVFIKACSWSFFN